jgi:hypothetical protein
MASVITTFTEVLTSAAVHTSNPPSASLSSSSLSTSSGPDPPVEISRNRTNLNSLRKLILEIRIIISLLAS